MFKHIQGLALALTVSGLIPALVAGAAISCGAVLDAAPWLFAVLAGAGVVKVWRWEA